MIPNESPGRNHWGNFLLSLGAKGPIPPFLLRSVCRQTPPTTSFHFPFPLLLGSAFSTAKHPQLFSPWIKSPFCRTSPTRNSNPMKSLPIVSPTPPIPRRQICVRQPPADKGKRPPEGENKNETNLNLDNLKL